MYCAFNFSAVRGVTAKGFRVVSGYVEKALLNCEVGAKYQFMRNGYFCKDKDST